MRRLLRDAHCAGNVATAGITDAMIGHQSVVTTQRRLLQERLEPVGEDAGVHEHDRFARADGSILQLDSVQRCSLPGFRISLLGAGALPVARAAVVNIHSPHTRTVRKHLRESIVRALPGTPRDPLAPGPNTQTRAPFRSGGPRPSSSPRCRCGSTAPAPTMPRSDGVLNRPCRPSDRCAARGPGPSSGASSSVALFFTV